MPTEWDGHRKEGRRSIALETHAFTMKGGPLRAFGYGQFRVFWIASFVSQVSFAMVLITRGWLVLELTDSPFLVTAVTATALLPPSLAAPFTGVMADRLNRRTILIMGEVATFVILLALSFLVLRDQVQVWHVFVLSALSGVAFAFILPTRPSLVPNLVAPRDMANGMALYTTLISASMFVGPAMAGYVIDAWSIGAAFLTASLLLIPAVALLLLMRPPQPVERPEQAPTGSVLGDLSEGLAYVVQRPALVGILLMALASAAFGAPYMTLLPVVARDILDVGPDGLGLLGAGSGIGALVGAFTVAFFSSSRHIKLLLFAGGLGIGPFLILFALSSVFAVSLAIVVVVGAVLQITFTSNITLVQMAVPDYIRGRVMGIRYVIMTAGPLGILLLGVGAEVLGPAVALSLMGLFALVLIMLILAAIPELRQLREPTGVPDAHELAD
ncbi:MAG: MFS transporter [Chloroflexi bacterium]|nr:MFS transporter [Chloroflexota bacterium]